MKPISVDLWFDDNAEEAVAFYMSVFKDSKILSKIPYLKDMPGPEGTTMYISFELNGQRFGAVNGGPIFKFNEAVSLVITCDDQEELDYYWDALSAFPENEQCGWLKDKYGVSWQVVPDGLDALMNDPDTARAERACRAVLSMKKLDIAAIEKAAAG